MESGQNVTLAMAVSGIQQTSGAWSNLLALAILMSVPVVVIFLVLHRYLLRGLLIGVVED